MKRHMGRPLQIHGSVHRDGGPANIQSVSHGPRCECHGSGWVGPEKTRMSWARPGQARPGQARPGRAGPGRAEKTKNDGPLPAHYIIT